MAPKKSTSAHRKSRVVPRCIGAGFTAFKLLKSPDKATKGIDLCVPGTFWKHESAREQALSYMCTGVDWTLTYREEPGSTPGPAVGMIECGAEGQRGTGAPFWIPYPEPFLEYWYKQFPPEVEAEPEIVDVTLPASSAVVTRENPDKVACDKVAFNGHFVVQLGEAELIREGKCKGRWKRDFRCKVAGCPGKFLVYGNSVSSINRHYTQSAVSGAVSLRREHELMLEELNEASCEEAPPPPAYVSTMRLDRRSRYAMLMASG